MLLTVILILSVALLFATLPRLYRPRRTITKARPETLEWKVGPDQKDFLLVNNRAFYGTIDGFEYEEGYVYRLKVKEYDLGSSRYGYIGERLQINSHDIQCVNKVYGIKDRPELFYQGKVKNSPGQYSHAFVDWLVKRHGQDEQFFPKTRARAKNSTNAVASDQPST